MKKIIHIENANEVTGGLNSLLAFCRLYKEWEHVWVLPKKSAVTADIKKEFKVYSLDFLEVSRRISVLNYLPRLFSNTRKLQRIIHIEQPDIVHINDLYNMLGVMIKIFGPKKKIVYHVRLLRTSYLSIMYPVFIALVKKYSDKIICVSLAVQKDIARPLNSTVIYTDSVIEKLPEWNGLLDTSSISVLYIANYIRGKGHQWAIYAIKEVIRVYPMTQLIFIGGSNNGSQEEFKNELKLLAVELNVSANVTFNGPTDKVEAAMKSADIILNLSESESFSMICLEAISYGVPLIASDCGGPAEVTDNGRQAYLVPNKNYKAAAAAIIEIIENPEIARGRAIAAKEYAKEKFNPALEKDALKEVYD